MEYKVQCRENVRIVIENDMPNFDVQLDYQDIEADSVLLRNLFTLTGTSPIESVIGSYFGNNSLPRHTAYSSVAIVEGVGKQYGRIDPGSIVVLPPQFSKYITLSNLKYFKQDRLLFKILPKEIDRVDATFLPLLCMAINICEDIQDKRDSQTIMLGCGLLGSIILKLLNLEDIHPIIILDEYDIKSELLIKNGSESVIRNSQNVSRSILDNVKNAFVLSSAEWAVYMKQDIQRRNCHVIRDIEDGAYSWMSHDVLGNAIGLLNTSQIYVKDLIAQHVHAEHVIEVFQNIGDNMYSGRSLIYDW